MDPTHFEFLERLQEEGKSEEDIRAAYQEVQQRVSPQLSAIYCVMQLMQILT